MAVKKIWHHYLKWEDYHAGMWKRVSQPERDKLRPMAYELTSNTELYGLLMLKVLEHWPIACEQNLSDLNLNRQAWIGHAACCLGIGCPEDITRSVWQDLTQEQKDKANAKASEAIRRWELCYAK